MRNIVGNYEKCGIILKDKSFKSIFVSFAYYGKF